MTFSDIVSEKNLRLVRKRVSKFNWQESYAGLVLAAIVTIVLGLLVANYFTRSQGQIGTGDLSTQQPTSEQVAVSKNYTVSEGDSLSIISEKVYGDINLWPALARVNKISNPSMIFTGTSLEIPTKDQAVSMTQQATVTSYKIVSGDTLFTIAQNVYGDGTRWVEIDTANNVGRLPNGNPLIFSGNVLTIPR